MSERGTRKLIAHVSAHLEEDVSLASLAAEAKRSPSSLQRRFTAETGESPRDLVERLRLERAAALLAASDEPVLDIAVAVGFQSHEVFTRAFRRRFDESPIEHRARTRISDPGSAQRHIDTTKSVGPCIGLFHCKDGNEEGTEMNYEVTKLDLPEQPILFTRRKVKPSEIAKTLAEVLPPIFVHAQKAGVPLVGQPFCRYAAWGPILTIEAGFPVGKAAPGEGAIEAGVLGGGAIAKTTHVGAYEKLGDAHAALQTWAEANHVTPSGAGWEVYVTDPGEVPDQSNWQTDVFLPL